MSLHAVVAHAENVPTLDVLGTPTRILLDGKQTHGAFAVVELICKPGDEIPPHVHHREEETFHVLEGEMEIWCGGHTTSLRAGDTFFAPRNIPHNPRITGSSGARILVVLTPAGFERAFRAMDQLASAGPPQPEAVATLLADFGCEFVNRPAPNGNASHAAVPSRA